MCYFISGQLSALISHMRSSDVFTRSKTVADKDSKTPSTLRRRSRGHGEEGGKTNLPLTFLVIYRRAVLSSSIKKKTTKRALVFFAAVHTTNRARCLVRPENRDTDTSLYSSLYSSWQLSGSLPQIYAFTTLIYYGYYLYRICNFSAGAFLRISNVIAIYSRFV